MSGNRGPRKLPDVCNFADFAQRPDLTHDLVLRRLEIPPTELEFELFPVRLGYSKVRDFASPHPIDEILYRIVGGRITGNVERALDESVVSWRLTTQPPAWRLWDKNESFARQRKEVRSLSRHEPFPGALVTDVTNYFPSIATEILIKHLTSLSAPREAVSYVEAALLSWQGAGLKGIPIGPETSALLGNVFLSPIDDELTSLGFKYVRLTDDLVVLPPHTGVGLDDVVSLIDDRLAQLGLKRSELKTERHYSAHNLLVSVGEIADSYFARPIFDLSGSEAVSEFMECLAEAPIRLTRLRELLGFFRSKRNTFPLRHLEARPDILKLAPHACGQYVAALSEVNPSRLTPFLDLVQRHPRQSLDAFLLHLLRAARMHAWPEAEGQQFSDLTFSVMSPLVRAEATMAWSRTPLWSREGALHLAQEDCSFRVRRAAVLTFRSVDPNRPFTQDLLKPIASEEPTLGPTVEYASA